MIVEKGASFVHVAVARWPEGVWSTRFFFFLFFFLVEKGVSFEHVAAARWPEGRRRMGYQA
jgi:hypothetical protein